MAGSPPKAVRVDASLQIEQLDPQFPRARLEIMTRTDGTLEIQGSGLLPAVGVWRSLSLLRQARRFVADSGQPLRIATSASESPPGRELVYVFRSPSGRVKTRVHWWAAFRNWIGSGGRDA